MLSGLPHDIIVVLGGVIADPLAPAPLYGLSGVCHNLRKQSSDRARTELHVETSSESIL